MRKLIFFLFATVLYYNLRDYRTSQISYHQTRIVQANAYDSTLILAFYTGRADRDSVILFDNQKFPSSKLFVHIAKVNAQFKLQWIKTISRTRLMSFLPSQNNNELYMVGMFGQFSNGTPMDSIVNIDGQMLKKKNERYNAWYISKLNTQNGMFSNSKIVLEANSSNETEFLEDEGGATFKEAVIDDDESIYIGIRCGMDSKFFIENQYVRYSDSTDYNGLALVKYNIVRNEYAISSIATSNNFMPYRSKHLHFSGLQFVPQTKQLIVSGQFYNGNVDFKLDTVRAVGYDIFIMSLNPNASEESELAPWIKKMTPNWLIYSKGQIDVDTTVDYVQIKNLFIDSKGEIYFSGGFNGRNKLDWRGFNSQSRHPGIAIISAFFSSKLTSLTSHIQHDATRMRAAQENAQYQWYDCGNAMQAVSGATDRCFTPSNVNGKYAVKVSNTWCSVMSDCQKLSVPLVNDLQSVQIYPNPVSHTLYLANLPIGVDIAVFDVMGRKIFSSSVQQSSFKINTESWSQGVYLVQLNYQGERWMEKVVK